MRRTVPHIVGFLLIVVVLATAIVTAVQEKVSLDKDPHLMEWRRFDETTGATAIDEIKAIHQGRGDKPLATS